MNRKPEKKWCAWCGKWGNHSSGSCPDFESLAPIQPDRNERGCMVLLLAVFVGIIIAGMAIGILTLITPEP